MKILKILKSVFSKNTTIQFVETSGYLTIEPKLKDLPFGETVYVCPWVYSVDTKELNLNSTFTKNQIGTSCMPITRTKTEFNVDFDFDYFGGTYCF